MITIGMVVCVFGLTGCSSSNPGQRTAALSKSLIAVRPDWADGIVRPVEIRGELHFVVGNEAVHEQEVVALQQATDSARAALAEMRETRIISDSESIVRMTVRSAGATVSNDTKTVLRSSATATLENSKVLRKESPRLTSGAFAAFVEVAVPESTLIPWAALTRLASRDAATEDYFDLARQYESRAHYTLAERTVRLGLAIGPTAENRMHVARFFERNRDTATALAYLATVLDETESDSPLHGEALRLRDQLTRHLPTVARSTEVLLELASRRASAEFTCHRVDSTGSRFAKLSLRLRERPGHRFIMSWIEDAELTPHVELGGEMSGVRDNIEFDRPNRPVTVLLWAVPEDSSLWRIANRIVNRTFVAGATDDDRLILRDFAAQLRLSRCLAVTQQL